MRVSERQLRYGLLFGAAAFGTGWGLTYLIAPTEALAGVERWRAVTWLYLNAHFVTVAGSQIGGFSMLGESVNVLGEVPVLETLYLVPLFLTVLGGVLMNDVVGRTTRFRHLLQNSASLLYGYFAMGALAFVGSDIQPAISLVLIVFLIFAAALYIGSTVVNSLTGSLPFIGIVSLGGVVAIGLIVIIGGLAVLQAIAPFLVTAGVGVFVGGVLTWISRNVPT